MSGKMLLKLDTVNYILQNHGSDKFAFLTDPAQSRHRTAFYFILAKLLFLDETVTKFKVFVAPFDKVILSSCHSFCKMHLYYCHNCKRATNFSFVKMNALNHSHLACYAVSCSWRPTKQPACGTMSHFVLFSHKASSLNTSRSLYMLTASWIDANLTGSYHLSKQQNCY